MGNLWACSSGLCLSTRVVSEHQWNWSRVARCPSCNFQATEEANVLESCLLLHPGFGLSSTGHPFHFLHQPHDMPIDAHTALMHLQVKRGGKDDVPLDRLYGLVALLSQFKIAYSSQCRAQLPQQFLETPDCPDNRALQ